MIPGSLRPALRHLLQHAAWKRPSTASNGALAPHTPLGSAESEPIKRAGHRYQVHEKWLGFVWGLALLMSSHPGVAQVETRSGTTDSLETRTVARRMADEAANLYEAGEYERAQDLFHRANVIYPAPVLELWEARALEKLGRLVEAEEHYAAVQRYKIKPEDTDVVRAAVADAAMEIEHLRKRIPTLTISIVNASPTDPNLEVHLDGKRLNPAMIGFPVPVAVGPKKITLAIRGREVARVDVSLGEGDRTPIELDPTSATGSTLVSTPESLEHSSRIGAKEFGQERSRPWYLDPTLGWVGVGVGSAGLVVGGITGLIAASKHNSLSANCTSNVCPPAQRQELDSFRAYRTASTVSYVIGGMALASGITILVLAPHRSNRPGTPALSLHFGPSTVSLRGRF